MFGVINRIKRNTGGAGDTGGNGGTPPPADQKPPEGDGLESLPESWQAKIKELRKEAEQNRLRRKELEDAQAAAEAKRLKDEQDKLAEQGQWKSLAEQRQIEIDALKAKAALADDFLKDIQERNTARVAKLPESAQKLIPQGLEPRGLSQWLDAAEETFAKPVPADLDSGRTGNRGNAPVDYSQYNKITF